MGIKSHIRFGDSQRTYTAEVLRPRGEGKYPFVIFLRGRESLHGETPDYAKQVVERGFGAVTVNFTDTELGQELKLTSVRNEHLQRAKLAFDAIFELPESEATALFAVGQSYGGYVAARLAGERPLAGVVLRMPTAGERFKSISSEWHDMALDSLKARQVPVLVVSPDSKTGEASYMHGGFEGSDDLWIHYRIAGVGKALSQKQRNQFGRVLGEWLETQITPA